MTLIEVKALIKLLTTKSLSVVSKHLKKVTHNTNLPVYTTLLISINIIFHDFIMKVFVPTNYYRELSYFVKKASLTSFYMCADKLTETIEP